VPTLPKQGRRRCPITADGEIVAHFGKAALRDFIKPLFDSGSGSPRSRANIV
jgi:hypothetical protein